MPIKPWAHISNATEYALPATTRDGLDEHEREVEVVAHYVRTTSDKEDELATLDAYLLTTDSIVVASIVRPEDVTALTAYSITGYPRQHIARVERTFKVHTRKDLPKYLVVQSPSVIVHFTAAAGLGSLTIQPPAQGQHDQVPGYLEFVKLLSRHIG